MTRARQVAAPAQTAQAQSPVRLKIDRLVLHGFAPADRGAIARGVQRELTRLMAEGHPVSAVQESRALERSDGGSVRVRSGAGSQETARQIAWAISRALRGSVGTEREGSPMRTHALGREEQR